VSDTSRPEIKRVMSDRLEVGRMWPWGHLAVAYLLSTGYVRARLDRRIRGESVLVLALGSQLPDLVDKPLGWYLGVLPSGRSLGHSLLFVVPVAVLCYALARRLGRREAGAVFGIGMLSHTLTDALPALWGPGSANHLLWPLLPTPYEGGAPGLLALFRNAASQPFFVVELLLVVAAAAVWYREGVPGVGTLLRASGRLG
jgi:membrane-bound metal-dependent hydrolase YbcI (DUF457 family)